MPVKASHKSDLRRNVCFRYYYFHLTDEEKGDLKKKDFLKATQLAESVTSSQKQGFKLDYTLKQYDPYSYIYVHTCLLHLQ